MSNDYNESRRHFFRAVARGLLLGASAAGIFGLIWKNGERCTGGGICRGCADFDACGLPQALSAREHGIDHGQ